MFPMRGLFVPTGSGRRIVRRRRQQRKLWQLNRRNNFQYLIFFCGGRFILCLHPLFIQMKAVVLYKSKYGTTKQYEEWIAEDLHADIFEADMFHGDDFEKYDRGTFGGGVY